MMGLYLSLIDEEDDRMTFKDVYQKYNRLLYKIAFDILHSHYDAQDAVSDTFLYLAKKFRKFSGLPEEKFTSLIVIMVRGRAINIYRKNKKCIPLEEIESECANDDITDLVDTEHLRNIISSLSDYDKEVLYLKCVLGMSYKEMSGILSIKESSVRQRMMHARNALKKKLMQEEEQYND